MKKWIAVTLVILAVLVAGCAEEKVKPTPTPVEKKETPKKVEKKKTPVPEKTPEKKETPKAKPTPKPTPKKVEAKSPVVECTVCHTKSVDYKPHVGGGQLCGNCHGWDPHKIHVGPGTIELDCKVCHGTPPKLVVPKPIEEGRTVCENCHAYPDAVKPSYGNLVNIHLPRGKYCTVCHGTDIAGIHKAADKFVEQ